MDEIREATTKVMAGSQEIESYFRAESLLHTTKLDTQPVYKVPPNRLVHQIAIIPRRYGRRIRDVTT